MNTVILFKDGAFFLHFRDRHQQISNLSKVDSIACNESSCCAMESEEIQRWKRKTFASSFYHWNCSL